MKVKYLIIIIIVAVIGFMILTGFADLHQIQDITDELPKAGSYSSRDLSEIQYLVIHHAAVNNQGPLDYANYHISKGWPGIGYHFVISPEGLIQQTNALETISYHVQGYNTKCIGIALSGNLNEAPMTDAQLGALRALIRKLKRKLPQKVEIKGHRDFNHTDCPGDFTDIAQI